MRKSLFLSVLLLLSCAALSAQTKDLGKSIFFDGAGRINLAVDARMAVKFIDAPYVMFMLFMTADNGVNADIGRNDITLVYKDQEYKMPSVKELTEGYSMINRDLETYWRLGLENLSVSEIRLYNFKMTGDFFPPRENGALPANTASMANDRGYRTNVYFKNPGFKPGDEVIIRVRDEKHPDIKAEVKVIL